MGVGSYDIQYTIIRFYKRGLKYNPDLIIWYLNNWKFINIYELIHPLTEQLIKKV